MFVCCSNSEWAVGTISSFSVCKSVKCSHVKYDGALVYELNLNSSDFHISSKPKINGNPTKRDKTSSIFNLFDVSVNGRKIVCESPSPLL